MLTPITGPVKVVVPENIAGPDTFKVVTLKLFIIPEVADIDPEKFPEVPLKGPDKVNEVALMLFTKDPEVALIDPVKNPEVPFKGPEKDPEVADIDPEKFPEFPFKGPEKVAEVALIAPVFKYPEVIEEVAVIFPVVAKVLVPVVQVKLLAPPKIPFALNCSCVSVPPGVVPAPVLTPITGPVKVVVPENIAGPDTFKVVTLKLFIIPEVADIDPEKFPEVPLKGPDKVNEVALMLFAKDPDVADIDPENDAEVPLKGPVKVPDVALMLFVNVPDVADIDPVNCAEVPFKGPDKVNEVALILFVKDPDVADIELDNLAEVPTKGPVKVLEVALIAFVLKYPEVIVEVAVILPVVAKVLVPVVQVKLLAPAKVPFALNCNCVLVPPGVVPAPVLIPITGPVKVVVPENIAGPDTVNVVVGIYPIFNKLTSPDTLLLKKRESKV